MCGIDMRDVEAVLPPASEFVVTAAGPHGWGPPLEAASKERHSPGGPNYTKRQKCNITEWKQQIKYPCYRIKDTQSLKDR